jgi:hypothetical protein
MRGGLLRELVNMVLEASKSMICSLLTGEQGKKLVQGQRPGNFGSHDLKQRGTGISFKNQGLMSEGRREWMSQLRK